MSVKRAIIGFKGLALAPVTTNTAESYVTSVGFALLHVGKMSHTVKESKQDLYYDDDLYAQPRNVSGEDVEITVAEVPLDQLEDMGLGVLDTTTNTLEADFSPAAKEYAMRWIADTVDGKPSYFNYRVFELTGISYGNFASRADNATVCEVTIKGVFKKPLLASLKPWAVMQLKDDGSNQAACTAFLTAAETKPVTP
ncbi:MAG TPA: hypothetical protein PKN45_10880 [Candidatus Limiplasma sp.]|nr:hypothetical protein [Candidatus Limiplasma sp.]